MPPFLTTSPFSLTPLPSSAMSWSTEDSFSESIWSWPARRLGRAELIGQAARRVGGDLELAALGLGDLVGALDADGRELAGVLPALADRAGDVGRDVLRVLAREDVGRHRRGRLAGLRIGLRGARGLEDLAVDDALERALAEAVAAGALEGLVEVRPGHAGGAGALEDVAGAALGDEVLLARHQVVAVVLELAARDADEQRGGRGSGESSPSRHRGGIVPVQGAGRPSRRPCAAAVSVRATPSHE